MNSEHSNLSNKMKPKHQKLFEWLQIEDKEAQRITTNDFCIGLELLPHSLHKDLRTLWYASLKLTRDHKILLFVDREEQLNFNGSWFPNSYGQTNNIIYFQLYPIIYSYTGRFMALIHKHPKLLSLYKRLRKEVDKYEKRHDETLP